MIFDINLEVASLTSIFDGEVRWCSIIQQNVTEPVISCNLTDHSRMSKTNGVVIDKAKGTLSSLMTLSFPSSVFYTNTPGEIQHGWLHMNKLQID